MKVRELIVQQNVDINACPKSYWFPSNKLIDYKDSISLKMFESRRTILNLDQTLRRLHLSVNPMYLNLEIFNSLVQLEQLEIENVSIVNCTPTLPNLKIFKFLPRSRNQQIKLQAPKLEVLYYNDPYGIELDRPETIKHLRTENFHNIMDVFKNLEILECGQIRYVNKEILSLFRALLPYRSK